MKGKILLVVGLGIGYVLGTRAGRERYEEIKKAASALWNDPRLQRQVDHAEAFVKDKAPDVVEFISDGAKKVVAQVSGSAGRATATKPAARKPAANTSKTPTAK